MSFGICKCQRNIITDSNNNDAGAQLRDSIIICVQQLYLNMVAHTPDFVQDGLPIFIKNRIKKPPDIF